MFDMRYHIVSLVAVFLALAVGILLGTVIIDKGTLVEQQAALVKRLESRFNQLEKGNRLLSKQIKTQEEFEEAVLPLVVRDVLKDKKVIMVNTTPVDETLRKQVLETLRQAGADVGRITLVQPDFKLGDEAVREKLSSYFLEKKESKGELKQAVLNKLASELVATSSESPFLTELSRLGLIETDNLKNFSAEGIILGGQQKDSSLVKGVDLPLAGYFQQLEVPVVAVETTEVEVSLLALYQKADVSTVDNVDMVAGRTALVYVLGGAKGSYGVGSRVDGLLPTLESE